MVYKFGFSVSGDNFWPETIIDKIAGDFVVNSFFSPTDKRSTNRKGEYREDEYEFGAMSFWHHKKFAVNERIVEYEKSYVAFIETDYELFIANGVDDLQIFMEIYYDGGQCNFEIFNKELLKKLAKFNVSLPISVYALTEQKIQQWENEIELDWQR